jgi:hypothetical protein
MCAVARPDIISATCIKVFFKYKLIAVTVRYTNTWVDPENKLLFATKDFRYAQINFNFGILRKSIPNRVRCPCVSLGVLKDY